jgi:hypothetical protein
MISEKEKVLILTKVSTNENLCYEVIPQELTNDYDFMLSLLKINSDYIGFVSEDLLNNYDFIKSAVYHKGSILEYASNSLINNKEIVFAAMTQNVYSLQYASDLLQNDKDLLKLLKDIKINKNYKFNQKWYDERLSMLNVYEKQEAIENAINKNSIKNKIKKF